MSKLKAQNFFLYLTVSSLLLFISLFPIPSSIFPSFAAQNVITVSPQLIQLDLSIDNPEAEFTYTNSTSQTIELRLSMQDVKELEDRGVPGFVNPNDTSNYKYGLSSWASFSNKDIVIPPSESKKIIVFIDKDRLSAGGHYASVLAEINQPDAAKPVKLRAIMASMLFVRTGGGSEVERANISDFRLSQLLFKFPYESSFRIQNIGNVDLTPRGRIVIRDNFGKEILKNNINEDSLITLPESVRKYSIKLQKPNSFILPGIYVAEIQVTYGKSKTQITKEIRFLSSGSINPIIYLGIIVLLVAGFILVKRKRRHNSIK